MASLDIFHNDAFNMIQLTTAVERNPYLPQGIGSLELFEPDPIRTKAMAVEERNGVLTLIPTSDRGSPPTERVSELRKVRYFEVPRLAHADTLKADEILGVREFGTESELMQVQKEVARRLRGPTGILANFEYTKENMRLGAISGQLLDADGTTIIYNWWNEFGQTQPAEIGFNLLGWQTGSATPTYDGWLRTQCNAVVRGMKRAAKGAFVDGVTEIMAMCGDAFWDEFITHPDIVNTYKNWLDAAQLRDSYAFRGGEASPERPRLDVFKFAGISWFNYRGSDDATTIGVPTTKVKFFLRKSPGTFRVAYAPAEFGMFLGSPGKEQYIIPIMDRDRQAWWRMEGYAYPLFICTRPETLWSGRAGT